MRSICLEHIFNSIYIIEFTFGSPGMLNFDGNPNQSSFGASGTTSESQNTAKIDSRDNVRFLRTFKKESDISGNIFM